MRQWVVHAWDATDEGALARRMSVRPDHLAGAAALRESGNYVLGGAMLDADDRMIGSTMVVQFETESELQAWLDREPYIQQGIWARYEVFPFRVANVGP